MKKFFYMAIVVASTMTLADAPRLPEFTQTNKKAWLNSTPLKLSDLKGKVILLDVWTFACWNCYRSFPWLRDLEARYEKKGLQVIGIHTPEFARERKLANVKRHIKKYKLKHPVMMDNDYKYWRALRNQYWPAFYVADKKGRVRGLFIGETHKGEARAKKIEALVKSLLFE